jgi:hypothetical protein
VPALSLAAGPDPPGSGLADGGLFRHAGARPKQRYRDVIGRYRLPCLRQRKGTTRNRNASVLRPRRARESRWLTRSQTPRKQLRVTRGMCRGNRPDPIAGTLSPPESHVFNRLMETEICDSPVQYRAQGAARTAMGTARCDGRASAFANDLSPSLLYDLPAQRQRLIHHASRSHEGATET